MVEKQIKDHSVHLRQLTAKAMTNKADAIKELIDYLILAHASSYVDQYFATFVFFYSKMVPMVVFSDADNFCFAFSHAELILERGIELI